MPQRFPTDDTCPFQILRSKTRWDPVDLHNIHIIVPILELALTCEGVLNVIYTTKLKYQLWCIRPETNSMQVCKNLLLSIQIQFYIMEFQNRVQFTMLYKLPQMWTLV